MNIEQLETQKDKTPTAEEAQPVIEPAESVLEEVVTVWEVANLFSLDQSTPKKAAKKGRIPARKSGKTWLMLREDARLIWGEKGNRKARLSSGPEHDMLSDVMTSVEVANWLGLDESTPKKAAKKGKIKARKAGKTWLMHRRDVSKKWHKRFSKVKAAQGK